jgi:hypothetical protein
MTRHLAPFLVGLLLAGCTTPAALRPTKDDLKPENIRILIAKELLRTPAFGSISVIKAKIIDAQISAPSERRGLFSGEPYIHYCVTAFIENPLFPIHQPAYAEVEVTESNGQRKIRVRSRSSIACGASNSEPYPEIEKLSLQRYDNP